MPNITMSIDEHLLRKARKVALERRSSVNGLFRDYLKKLTEDETSSAEKAIERLRVMWKKHRIVVGERKWTREELYER
ncbi:MAG: hypothetical protein HQL18_00950 [Candidatus Omnitrophica bacterium]|nr:hypothetical protein [Candidatus Omnitrophota bacterium]